MKILKQRKSPESDGFTITDEHCGSNFFLSNRMEIERFSVEVEFAHPCLTPSRNGSSDPPKKWSGVDSIFDSRTQKNTPCFAHPQTKKKSTPKGVKKGQRWSKSKVDVHNSVHKHSKSSVGTTKRARAHTHTHTHTVSARIRFFIMSRNNEAMNEMSFRFLCKMAFLAPKRVVFSIHLT